jgi:hypothetical protein
VVFRLGRCPLAIGAPIVPLTPEQRRLRAQIAAHASHVNHDPRDRTAAASAATPQRLPFWERKVRVDYPDIEADIRAKHPGVSPGELIRLIDAEYTRRAEHLYKAHMRRLALASSKARAARKAATAGSAA